MVVVDCVVFDVARSQFPPTQGSFVVRFVVVVFAFVVRVRLVVVVVAFVVLVGFVVVLDVVELQLDSSEPSSQSSSPSHL